MEGGAIAASGICVLLHARSAHARSACSLVTGSSRHWLPGQLGHICGYANQADELAGIAH